MSSIFLWTAAALFCIGIGVGHGGFIIAAVVSVMIAIVINN